MGERSFLSLEESRHSKDQVARECKSSSQALHGLKLARTTPLTVSKGC